MSGPLIIGLSGNLSETSRTLSLVSLTASRIAAEAGGTRRVINLAALSGIGALRNRSEAGPVVEAALRDVESADLLVVGSPVYKGSYTGLFKHFIDFIDYRALIGTPVALLATGGSERHALVIEHQLRPLFGFFQARVLGTGLFLTDQNFTSTGEIADPVLNARLDQVVREGADALSSRTRSEKRPAEAAA